MDGTRHRYSRHQIAEVVSRVRRSPDTAVCPVHRRRLTVRIYAVDVNGDGRAFDSFPLPYAFQPAFYTARCEQCNVSVMLPAQIEAGTRPGLRRRAAARRSDDGAVR